MKSEKNHSLLSFKHISIPQPCHEDWNQMTAEEKGRHCALCNKVVIDFTDKTEEELTEILRGTSGKTCGRFNRKQIFSPLPGTITPRTLYSRFQMFVIALVAAFGLSFLAPNVVQAQESIPQHPQLHQLSPTPIAPTNEHGQEVETEPVKIPGSLMKTSFGKIVPIAYGQIGVYSTDNVNDVDWKIADEKGSFTLELELADLKSGKLRYKVMDKRELTDQKLKLRHGRLDLTLDPNQNPLPPIEPYIIEEEPLLGDIEYEEELGWVDAFDPDEFLDFDDDEFGEVKEDVLGDDY